MALCNPQLIATGQVFLVQPKANPKQAGSVQPAANPKLAFPVQPTANNQLSIPETVIHVIGELNITSHF